MNKTAIKNFSIWARNKLIADISYRAGLMGITETGIVDPLPQSTDMTEFYDIGTTEPYTISGVEIKQRRDLADAINRKEADSNYETAYKCIIEEVAYTWFNRLIAVRFMEVNDYLPSYIRVLSSESGKMEPDLVTTPFDADLEFTAEEEKQIINLKRENALDEMFRLLFVKQCNALNSILPGLFEKTGDYTELLLNLSITDRDGVVYHLVHDIDEADFDIETKDENGNAVGQVEIIGWLYQYYNTEPKAKVFDRPSGTKIKKEEIPAATQLFTPDWIVRYMVENSLGRLWVEGHPNNELKTSWKYYLDEAEQGPEVEAQLDEIRKENSLLTPEDIKFIDPCMGSGHILVYAFDVLMQIYKTQGYTMQDAVKSILQNNLYGLDIDERAAQLSYFSVMMKARSYDKRFFNRNIQPHVYAIQESNNLSKEWLPIHEQMQALFDCMKDAKDYGSLIVTPSLDYNVLRASVQNRIQEIGQVDFEVDELQRQMSEILNLIDVAEILSEIYDVVVTNPPYMGGSGMDKKLSNLVKEYYPECKNDLFAVFIKRCEQMTKKVGYQAMITQQAWMFLSSYEKLRGKLIKKNIVNMLHMGSHAFEEISGEVVQTTSFVMRNIQIDNYIGIYCRLIDQTTQQGKENAFLDGMNRYYAKQENFSSIPGSPIAYWMSTKMLSAFISGKQLGNNYRTVTGSSTGENARFLRFWQEVNLDKVAFEIDSSYSGNGYKWVPCIKGGEFCKWYGNFEYLINWENDGAELKAFATMKNNGKHWSRFLKSLDCFYMSGITWSKITSGNFSARYMPEGFIMESAACAIMPKPDDIPYILALMNSVVVQAILRTLNPTLNVQAGNIGSIPVLGEGENKINVDKLAINCIELTKNNWDSYETSWDFGQHPFVRLSKEIWDGTSVSASMDYYYGCLPQVHSPLELCWLLWQGECNDRFDKLKTNEEELNRIFIEIYGLQDELLPEEEDKDVTVRRADLQRDIRSFLSYAVGCMFGRYSLDIDGLAYAGGEWDDSKYTSFQPDADDIIPITDEEYLEDDIVSCLCQWLKAVYGEETLEENLDFIAQALGNKGDSSREIIRNYFLKDFFADHCKIYQKRPIYWMFDSGKQNGFKALVYLHRYTPDTIGNLRIDYLHRMQRIYDGEIIRMQDTIEHSDNSREVTKATKRKEKLQKQLKECQEYDEQISHLALSRIELDLDDGVKINYEKVQTAQDGKKYQVLAKI